MIETAIPVAPVKPVNLFTVATMVLWLAVITGGTLGMIRYAETPGPVGTPPGQWPAASSLRPDAQNPTLVMFVHPKCPCSRATMEELARLMARCQGRLTAEVLFLQPAGAPTNWSRTDLWRAAAAIPGVRVLADKAGQEAGCFHAGTSGETALYDRDGKLMFHGGITIGRGHAGDNPGVDDIEEALDHAPVRPLVTPVYGCELTGTEVGKEGLACKR